MVLSTGSFYHGIIIKNPEKDTMVSILFGTFANYIA